MFAIFPEKHGVKVDFLPPKKHESFLQGDSIILGFPSQAYPKSPKQVYNSFVISQGKCEG